MFHIFGRATAASSINRSPAWTPRGAAHGGPERFGQVRQQSGGERLQTQGDFCKRQPVSSMMLKDQPVGSM
eukprot:9494079-Lingulodinium_polyedra.AAC.1